jgi:hypothetical protein
MGQSMRVTVDAAMRARDVSRIRPEDEAPKQPEPAQPTPRRATLRRAEKRRLAKRGAGQT